MFDTRQIARACHIGEPAIRQWLSRSPGIAIGSINGHARTYNEFDAMTIVIAAEMLRHRLGRPHECLPIAQAIADQTGTMWACRPHGGDIVITADRPDCVAIAIPLDFLRSRLATIPAK